jgi:predicted O-methyltransferase YrrM
VGVSEEIWSNVDDYVVGLLSPSDEVLDAALADSDAGGLPPINVSPSQGKFLSLLAKSHRAKRVLEIGTLGGYSTIWLARALPSDGSLVSLELEQHHADVARKNIERAGFTSQVQVRVGPATESLKALAIEAVEPFDFIFIDADKEGYPDYLELSLALSQTGTLIVADNVVRDGDVVNPDHPDSRVHGVRAFLTRASEEQRLSGTVMQTVGAKGYDGFAIFLVA